MKVSRAKQRDWERERVCVCASPKHTVKTIKSIRREWISFIVEIWINDSTKNAIADFIFSALGIFMWCQTQKLAYKSQWKGSNQIYLGGFLSINKWHNQ